ncbi:hypothetical protein CHS0354_022671 [Potamilus streckersoni]|uniref:Uncharacterized protein n=1 Tax=Potamilus streckersoni TaxID=2493646 RepID=A0AAE0S7C2_9BIVA|nr:hypothetical protein CHS0354_022671 [Potamilus streckersoni]
MYIFIGLILYHCLLLALTANICPNTTLCTCTFDILDCSGHRLGGIPAFRPSDKYIATLRLYNAELTQITNSSFAGINVSDILLNNNRIRLFLHGAFDGAEDVINALNLSHNALTTIPTAIGTLRKIQSLDISLNPINQIAFDSSGDEVLKRIGDTLHEFSFGHNTLYEWPHALRHLVTLKTLNVLGGSFKTLPPAAFHGFEGTLLNLRIENTKLIAIPVALSRLIYLERLNFDHNHFIGDAGILVPSFSSTILRYLNDLTLKDDSLTVFPNILKYLGGVQKLSLEGNKLDVIGDNSIKVIAAINVRDLSLRNCNLSRVPGAISSMRNLSILDLSKNNIHSFERNDFTNMSLIKNLTVSNNPLNYISPDAFNELHNLIHLNLQDTDLTEIPTAIENSPDLRDVILPKDQIICTCDLSWLKKYRDTHKTDAGCPKLSIQGTCETIISSIERYLHSFIPMCPNYNVTTESSNDCYHGSIFDETHE